MDENTANNTDKQLWENPEQDEGYRDTVSVTEKGLILLCSGGYCVGKTVKEWVEIAWPKIDRGINSKTSKMTEFLTSLRNNGCGRQRNQNFIGQDYRENCQCCEVVRERIDEFFNPPLSLPQSQ